MLDVSGPERGSEICACSRWDEVNVDVGFLALFLYIDTNRERERERDQCLRSGGIH